MGELLKFVLLLTIISIGVLAIMATLFISNLNKSLIEFLNKTSSVLDEFKDLKKDVTQTLSKVDEMSESVIKLNDEVKEIKNRTFVSMNNLDTLTEESHILVRKINLQTDEIIDNIKPYKELVGSTYEKFAQPINNIIGIASALNKAFNVFKSRFR